MSRNPFAALAASLDQLNELGEQVSELVHGYQVEREKFILQALGIGIGRRKAEGMAPSILIEGTITRSQPAEPAGSDEAGAEPFPPAPPCDGATGEEVEAKAEQAAEAEVAEEPEGDAFEALDARPNPMSIPPFLRRQIAAKQQEAAEA